MIKGDGLQSHTARRTFCTGELLNGTDIPIIMAISRHKDVKTFLSYVKASSEVMAEKIKKTGQPEEYCCKAHRTEIQEKLPHIKKKALKVLTIKAFLFCP